MSLWAYSNCILRFVLPYFDLAKITKTVTFGNGLFTCWVLFKLTKELLLFSFLDFLWDYRHQMWLVQNICGEYPSNLSKWAISITLCNSALKLPFLFEFVLIRQKLFIYPLIFEQEDLTLTDHEHTCFQVQFSIDRLLTYFHICLRINFQDSILKLKS